VTWDKSIWGFPYLDYPISILASWSCKSGCTTGLFAFDFINFCIYRILYLLDLSLLLFILLLFLACHLCITLPVSYLIFYLYYYLTSWLAYSWFYMNFLVTIYIYYLLVCMTWVPDILHGTCSFYSLIPLFEDNSGCVHTINGDMRYMVYIWVSLFGLSPRRTNLMNPSIKLVQLVLSHLLIIHYLMPHLTLLCVCSWHSFWYMLFQIDFINTRVFAYAPHLTLIL